MSAIRLLQHLSRTPSGGGSVTAPTFIQVASTPSWAGNTLLTSPTFAVQIGDVLVHGIIISDFDGNTPTVTNTNTALTWTARVAVQVSNNCTVFIYTAVATAAETIQINTVIVLNGGNVYGISTSTWRGSTGVGAYNGTTGTGAPSYALTTTSDNSAIVMFNGDWSAVTGSSRAYRTINSNTPTPGGTGELFYDAAGVGSTYVVYGAYWPNVGTAGAKTTGLTTPSQTFAIAAIEVKGT